MLLPIPVVVVILSVVLALLLCSTVAPVVAVTTPTWVYDNPVDKLQYRFYSTPTKTWDNARAFCKTLGPGWDLGEIKTVALWNALKAKGVTGAWIGGHKESGVYTWIRTNVPMSSAYQDWQTGEPNNSGDCIWTWQPKWDDWTCSQAIKYMCSGSDKTATKTKTKTRPITLSQTLVETPTLSTPPTLSASFMTHSLSRPTASETDAVTVSISARTLSRSAPSGMTYSETYNGTISSLPTKSRDTLSLSRFSPTHSDEATLTNRSTSTNTEPATESRTQSLSAAVTPSPTSLDTASTTISASVPATPSPTFAGTSTPTYPLTESVQPTASATFSNTEISPETHHLSHTLTDEKSPTNTIHIVVKPEPALPVEELFTSVSVIAAFAGAGVVAGQQARLNTAKKLIRCGEGDFEEEPDRLSSPFKWQVGARPFQFVRGQLLGIITAMAIITAVVSVLAFLYAIWKGETFKVGLLRLRMPGILIVPLLVFIPPAATACTILFWWGHGAGDMFLAIFSCALLVFGPIVYVASLCWICSKGKVVIHFNNADDKENEEPDEFAEKFPTIANSCVYKMFVYLSETQFEFSDNKFFGMRDDDPLAALMREEEQDSSEIDVNEDLFAGLLSSPSKTQQQQRQNNNNSIVINDPNKKDVVTTVQFPGSKTTKKLESAHSSRKSAECANDWFSQNEFNAKHALVYEDFSACWDSPSYWFATIDIIVAALLGLSAGTASGLVSVPVCIVAFCVDELATALHLLLLLKHIRRTMVTPRFVMGYMYVGSFITWLSVSLAFAMYLGRLKESGDKAWGYIAIIQSVLGMIAGLIGLCDVCIQLWDAIRVRGKRKKKKGGDNFIFNLDDDILLDLEEELGNIDIEAELAALPSMQQQQEEPDVDIILLDDDEPAAEDIDILAELGDAEQEVEVQIVQEEEEPVIDLNHLLEDDDADGRDGDDPYKLDDGEEEGGTLNDDGTRTGVGASRGNEEMLANLANLTNMLGGEATAAAAAADGGASSLSRSSGKKRKTNFATI